MSVKVFLKLLPRAALFILCNAKKMPKMFCVFFVSPDGIFKILLCGRKKPLQFLVPINSASTIKLLRLRPREERRGFLIDFGFRRLSLLIIRLRERTVFM